MIVSESLKDFTSNAFFISILLSHLFYSTVYFVQAISYFYL